MRFVVDNRRKSAVLSRLVKLERRYKSLADFFEQNPDVTQESIAVRLGISKGHMCHITAGKRRPSLELAREIEALTGVPMESHLERSA